ncbi:dethiobiotin synthase [uncultured Pseudoteredinibacter sp.]|uniref:dethiobiotin synthase n=1 Tax=uncultured Pseudoteredinibacter sp. TaxID=1641701 RepID=UPI00260ACC62|nr:dethiobiotin synthase [uncultured Pseudoteredinibacter sp.]
MAKKTFFVTGTDTDAGKTFIASALLHKANSEGLRSLALKPVASGSESRDEGLRNSDALILQEAMSEELDYEQINPYAFEPAIAPHIAAEQAGVRLNASRLAGFCRGALFTPHDFSVVEGAGGWRVPLNDREDFSDLAKELSLPVILVVGLRLGCINHALLTIEAIRRDGLTVAGWVANHVDPNMSCMEENLETLKQRMTAPYLGFVPNLAGKENAAISASQYLHLPESHN